MKKLFSLFFIAIIAIATQTSFAQSTANYVYTTSTTGSLTDMSSGTTQAVGFSSDDVASGLLNVGFDLWFQGTRYNQFSVNSNGGLQLGTTLIGTTAYYNVGVTALPYITAMGSDQRTTATGKVHYKVTGSAPNRVLVVEWKNMYSYFSAAGEVNSYNYQVRLYETSGVIEFVYGSMTMDAVGAGAANSQSPRIGFSSNTTATTTGYILAPQSGSPAPTYTAGNPALGNLYVAGVITALSSVADGSRRVFTFTPPIPTAPSGLNFTAVTTTGMTLNWTDNSANELGFAIYRSDDGGTTYNFINQVGAGIVTSAQAGLGSGATYFWRVYAVTEGGLSTPLNGSQATNAGTICGTIPVGPTGTYASLTAAITAINTNGLCGPVILELQPTYLSTVETYPVTVLSTTPTSSTNTLTIRPQTGAVGLSISSANTTATINLNGARFVTIDGRPGGSGAPQLTIANTALTGPALQYINDARFNTVQYCTITGVNTSVTSGVIFFSTTTGTIFGNSNNTITNSDIRDGATTPANLIFSNGTSLVPNKNNTVSNCNLYNWFFNTATQTGAINLLTGSSDWTITGCSFYQTVTRTFTTSGGTVTAISVNNTVNSQNYTITNNFIGGTAPLCGGGPLTYTFAAGAGTGPVYRMLFISTSIGAVNTVTGNTIANLSLTTGIANTLHSLISHNTGNILIANNTIGSQSTTGNITFTNNSTTLTTPNFIPILAGITGALSLTITNNNIGSITANTVTLGVVSLRLISANVLAGSTLLINNNTIGGTAANSVQNLTNAAFFTGMLVSSTSQDITITGNTIQNLTGNNTGVTLSVVGMHIQNTGKFTVTNNIIRNLTNNAPNITFGNAPCVSGIVQLNQAISPQPSEFSGNQIYNLNSTHTTAACYVIGMVIFPATVVQTNYIVVTNNLIYGLATSSSTAIQIGIGNLSSAGSGPSYYANNMISIGSGNTNSNVWGFYKGNPANVGFYFNSIYVGGSNVTSGGSIGYYRVLSGTADTMMNNIIFNARSNSSGTGKHYIMNTNANTFIRSNFNIGFGTGTGFVYGVNAGTDYATLTAWTATTGLDPNSKNSNPQFLNPTAGTPDLHISPINPTEVEGNGFNLAHITTDYDSQSRSGLTPVDIGADAGNFVALDLTPPAITYTLLGNATPAPSRSFTGVAITDASGINTTFGTRPRVYYKKTTAPNTYTDNTFCTDGWKWVESNGTSTPFDFTINYSLLYDPACFVGGLVSAGDIIQYFVVAQDIAGPPNVGINSGTFSGSPASVLDYANIFPLGGTINQYSIAGLYSGTYTVGTNLGDNFFSLTGAGGLFEALNAGVMSGNITALVTSDLVEPGTNALNQISYDVAGANYTLRIVPQTASEKLISGSVANALIRFNGNDFVTIDGNNGLGDRYLRFRNINGLNPTFLFQNDARRNTITNCFIESNNAGALGVTATIVIGGTTFTQGNDSLFFINCDIRDRSDAAGTPINAILASGNTAAPNNHMLISGCNIYNTFNASVTFVDIYFLDGNADMTIQNNSFYQTATRSPSNAVAYFCMIMATSGSNNVLTGNFLGGTAPLCGGTPMTFTDCAGMLGFRFFTTGITSPTTASNNTIANMDIGSTGTGAGFLFRAFDINGSTAAFVNCTNNTIGSMSANDNIIIRFNPAASTAGPGPCVIGFGFNNGTLGFPIGSVTGNTIGGITLTGTGTTTATVMSLTGIGIGPTVNTAVNVTGNTVGGTVANSIQNTMAVNTNSLTMNAISSTAVTNVTGVNISNNTVRNLNNSSINATTSFLRGIFHTGTSGFNANNNTINDLNCPTTMLGGVTTPNIVGIFSTSGALNQTMNQNTVFNLNATTIGVFSPVVCGIGMTSGSATMTQSRNRIYGLTNTATGSPQIYGILNYWGTTTGSGCLAVNNQISITNGELTDSHLREINSDLSSKTGFSVNLGTSLLGHSNKVTELKNESVKPVLEIKNNQSRELGIYQQPIIQQPVYQSRELGINQSRELGINQNNNRVNGMNKNTNGKGTSDPTVTEGEIYVAPPVVESIKKPINQTDALNGLTIFGIWDDATSPAWNYYYNSVYVGGEASTGTLTSFSFRKTSSANNIINNIFYNGRRNSGTATGNHYAFTSTGTPSVSTNYNVFINVNPATLFLNTVDQTIGAWRTATGRDRQSWSTTASDVTPAELFTNVLNGNLNIVTASPEAWIVSGKGIAIAGQNIDFNGNVRVTAITSGTTDIGSNEIAALLTTTPLATQDNAPGSGVTSTYTLWSRPIARVVWGTGGSLYPTSLNVFYNSGINPPGTLGGFFSNSHTIVNPIGSMPDTRYNITYSFGDNETYTIGTPALSTVLAKYNGATWEVFLLVRPEWNTTLVYSIATQTYTVAVVGLWDFGTFALTDNGNALPVTLESFEIAVNKRDAILNWATTSEMNNKGFGVERRIKLEKGYSAWIEKAFVNGNGTTNERRVYSYKDANLVSGVYQYRLRQEDYNNNIEYYQPGNNSDVTIGKPGTFDLSQNYPNPSNPKSKIDFQMPFDGKVSIKVYDILGREVASLINDFKPADFYTVEFDGTNISSGTYFYRIIAEGGNQKFTKTLKMILVK